MRVCLTGHEWVKQQLRREAIAFTSLDNGVLRCAQPERLQTLAASLSAADVQRCFDRWVARLPWPLTAADRAAGFTHRLSLWQLEVSLTQVFDRPLAGRHCFEALIREHLDLGRPDRVSRLFPTKLTRRTPAPPHGYRTRVLTAGVAPSLHSEYHHSHVTPYFTEERALRTETTINDPTDFGPRQGLDQLASRRTAGEQVNRKLLEAERVSQDCLLSADAFDRLQQPTIEASQRAPALRFGDPRVMALFQALCGFAHLPQGFRNRERRPTVAALLGLDLTSYTASRMTDELRRLRLKGLIHRIAGTTRSTVTTYGLRVAFCFTTVALRILRPAAAALTNDGDRSPAPLAAAFHRVDAELAKLCDAARIAYP